MNKYKVSYISLGCPKNQVDCEILIQKLVSAGFEEVDLIEDADVVIVNTCGFIDIAKQESINEILEVAEYKKAGLISAIVVTGCLAERYQDEIIKEIPEVDAVAGIGANNDIVKICQKALCGITTSIFPNKCYLPLNEERLVSTPSHWAYLKLSDGCNNKCSYCAIPLIRGEYRERAMESILDEAKQLVNSGVKELILIAQDTTKYGIKLYNEYKLPSLLKELCKIDGLEWIRLYYCYPDKVTDELIDVIATEEKICKYIDIPLQHCNKDILKAMNRSGSYEELKELINKMRSRIPELAIRTTFLVGFPGETEEQFEELCGFVKEMKFDNMGCFAFSAEEGTPAAEMKNQIDEDVKAKRAEIITDIQFSITEALNKKRFGKVYKTIISEPCADGYIGRSYFYSPEIDCEIIIETDEQLEIGSFYDVRITDYNGYDLIGELV